jgi:hypothetical protein
MKERMKTVAEVLVLLVVLGLLFGGSAATVVGFLYAVWTGEWMGIQIALTGLIAMLVGFVGGMIVSDL